MARREYDWIDDPFNPEREAEDQEALRAAKNGGCVIFALVFLLVVILIAAAVFLPSLLAGFAVFG